MSYFFKIQLQFKSATQKSVRTLSTFGFSVAICSLIVAGCSRGEQNRVDGSGLDTTNASQLEDFLTQDVCVVDGIVTSHDPASCPSGAERRNLRLGERIPYHRVDQLNNQAANSFAMLAPDGAKMWTTTYDWGPTTPYLGEGFSKIAPPLGSTTRQAFFEMTTPESSPGAYDIVDTAVINANPLSTNPGWVAFAGTDILNFVDVCESRGSTGGWLLIPPHAKPGSSGVHVSELNSYYLDEACDDVRALSRTTWTWTPMHYTNGKVLDTIWVDHTCNDDSDPTNDCFERHFFTREYGMTRWERWQSDGIQSRPTSPNPMGCNGPWENGHLWRKFCRDFTNVVPNPGNQYWNPRSHALHPRLGRGNLVVDGDFASRGTEHWQMARSNGSGLTWSVTEDSKSANHSLELSCSNCAGDSIFQDVARPASMQSGSTVWWGGDFSADQKATVSVHLYQLSASGEVVDHDTERLALSSNQTTHSIRQVQVHAAATILRWQVFVETSDATIALDNAFVTNW